MPLRITVELIPHGLESQARKIGSLEIVNDGTGTKQTGNYAFTIYGPVHGGDVDVWWQGEFQGYERNRGYWSLVKKILNRLETDHQPIGR